MTNTPFKLKSGNSPLFKNIGSSPTKDLGHGGHRGLSEEDAAKRTHGGKMSKKDIAKRKKHHKESTATSLTGKLKHHVKSAAKEFVTGLRTVTGTTDADIEKERIRREKAKKKNE